MRLNRTKFLLLALTLSLVLTVYLPAAIPNAHAQMVGTTILNVKISSTIIYPGVNFTISGLLETTSGEVLPYKNLTITCVYESFQTMTNGFGEFNSDVSFPPGSHAGPTNVTVTYTPYPYSQDVQMYLVTSTSVPVTLEYPQSVLSAQTFAVQTPFPKPKSISFHGNAYIDTSQSRIGTGSLKLESTGDEITTDPSSDFAFGTHDFTFDMWVRFSALPQTGNSLVFLQQYQNPGNVIIAGLANVSNTQEVTFYSKINGGSAHFASGPIQTISTDVWYHVAWVRSNGTVTIYWNGENMASVPDNDTIPELNTPMQFGSYPQLYGWLDEVRISNVARWTTNFTPPTTPYHRDISTVLLLHFDDPNGTRSTTDDVDTSLQTRIYQNITTVTESRALAVIGKLTTQTQTPLELRNITIYLDGNPVGNTTTTNTGSFAFSFIVPEILSNGPHEIVVSFAALNDTYAPSKTILQFDVAAPSNSTFTTTAQITQTGATTTQPTSTNILIIPIIAAILLASTLSSYFLITRRKKTEPISENIPSSSPDVTSEISPKTSSDVHCEFCGRLIPRNSNYCDRCGKPNLLKDQ